MDGSEPALGEEMVGGSAGICEEVVGKGSTVVESGEAKVDSARAERSGRGFSEELGTSIEAVSRDEVDDDEEPEGSAALALSVSSEGIDPCEEGEDGSLSGS